MENRDLEAAAAPERIVAALRANQVVADEMGHATGHGAGHGNLVSVRSVTHRGHQIVIRTRYEIEVDGEPFETHVNVDNTGRVSYHGLPTRDFPSAVDLMKQVIDAFPGDFEGGTPADPADPDQGGQQGEDPSHGHGGQHTGQHANHGHGDPQ